VDIFCYLTIIGNIMEETQLASDSISTHRLKALGADIRARRKQLRISAVATAEAAGISRVTLHRIEKGEASVAMGAYSKTLSVLGLDFRAVPMPTDKPGTSAGHGGWIPARIVLADYPQLKTLAWHVKGVDTLTPIEALDIYERNVRHLDTASLTPAEQDLLQALRLAFTNEPRHV